MQSIGVRELRQYASKYLHAVQRGDRFEVTDHGRPVALLIPLPDDPYERLIATGRMKQGKRNLHSLSEPLPTAPDEPLLSEILEEMRADER